MDKSNTRTEYATQFFDFVPQTMVDEISEDANELIQGALEAMKQKITSKYSDKVDPNVIQNGIDKIEEKYLFEMDRIFEKLVSYLCAHVLSVPNHVLLPEDNIWDSDTSGPNCSNRLAKVNVELDSLRNKIKSALYKKTVLQQSLENIQEICQKQESKISSDELLYNNYNIGDWKDTVDFTKQNKEALDKRMKVLEQMREAKVEDQEQLLSKRDSLEIERLCNAYLENYQRKEAT